MSIPKHIIEIGARALYEAERADNIEAGVTNPSHPHWEHLDRLNTQRKYLTRARRIIEATSKRIWDSGYAAGVEDTHAQYQAPDPQTTPNPYRSVTE